MATVKEVKASIALGTSVINLVERKKAIGRMVSAGTPHTFGTDHRGRPAVVNYTAQDETDALNEATAALAAYKAAVAAL